MANHANADREPGAAPDISRFLRTEASGLPPEVGSQGTAFRDIQKALVERIADVDDDRRRGAAALLKAFNAHRTQVRVRLKHQQLTLGVVLGVPLLLLAAGLFWLAWTTNERAHRQDTRVAALEAGLTAAQAAATSGSDTAWLSDLNSQVGELRVLNAQLARDLEALRDGALNPEQVNGQLTGQLTPLLARLTALENRPEPPATAGAAPSGKAATAAIKETARAEATAAAADLRREFTTGLAALRAELATLREQAGTDAAAVREAVVQAALEQMAPKLAEATSSAADQAVASVNASLEPRLAQATRSAAAAAASEAVAAINAALAERETAAGATALPLDALIEQQVTRLEQEYQRLAREVAAPAADTAAPVATAGQPATAVPEQTPAQTPPQPAGDDTPPETAAPPAGVADAPPTDPPAAAVAGSPATDSPPAAVAGSLPTDPPAAQPPAQMALDGPTVQVGDQGYALQLIGFHEPAALLDFIARHALPGQVYSREEQLRGRPWYVLIHSLHPDLASASAAQAGLPADLAGMDVWIRALPADAELRVLQTGQ